MGNGMMDFSMLRYSKCSWRETNESNTVKCVQDSVMGSFMVVKRLDILDAKCLVFRALNNDCLVDVLAVYCNERTFGQESIISEGKTGRTMRGYTIVIQKIIYRLPDFGSISYRDGIYVLSQGLKAMKILASMFQNFLFEEEYIGFNSNGECKYWINQNYFKSGMGSPVVEEEHGKQQERTQFLEEMIIEEETCRWRDVFKEGNGQQNKNLNYTFMHLLEQVEGRMKQNMSQNQKQKYSAIKKKYINQGSNSHQKLSKIQKFIKTLCETQKIPENYRLKLSNDILNIKKMEERISLRRIKSEQKISEPVTKIQNKKKLSKLEEGTSSKVSLKMSTKIKINQGRLTAPTSITKSVVKYQNNWKAAANEGNLLHKDEHNNQSRIWQLIQ